MIKRPIENDSVYLHIILFFITSILLLAFSVILAYWYVFGDNNKSPMMKAAAKAEAKTYVNPKHQLTEVMWQKFLNFNANQ
ncbi:MAG: hypothetical protein UT48_C0010G0023 [Parcubacteria group bacterium GW2011_GWE2_39_37]|uniref:Uncharacterized protein n=1 Tax=Candidatus Falkowbacteria bacterium GW2011_GWF2_39_8 TaxID=1618642 RepID=A0A0G0T020_9BACT|nr:MAG: hypothetical protein UT48_C0010G0023 [Parcubacteria group bacterium GW2011_GWE2_39_37]KKR31152.1 MAG: hypothetical protein UT64_C0071G0006 [Candidatus Falkowbacteria bacterium GW2011_GWF2_39_8]